MGLFDTVGCEYPLPEARHQELEFQTKGLECVMDHFTITRDGRLIRHPGGWSRLDRDVEWPVHGDIRIYTSDKTQDPSWIEYVVRFTHGRVEWIRSLEEARWAPGFTPPNGEPLSESTEKIEPEAEPKDSTSPGAFQAGGEDAGRDAEEALLLGLRRHRSELEELLAKCSDHWGYEDPVYRFYHQSFKVYWLQEQTRSIVGTLQALVPGLALNPWFLQIVAAGTGKVFKPEDNERWTEVTRPILEAFFHARFFLEMAVRYTDRKTPPRPLPSGYAALLYLFCIR